MDSFGSAAGSRFSEASVLTMKGKGAAEENTVKDLDTRSKVCVMEAETRASLLLIVNKHRGLLAASTTKRGKSLMGDLGRNCP